MTERDGDGRAAPRSAGSPRPDGSAPLAVRVIRGVIAVLVWGALALPIGGLFRWVGEALAMPPSYTPAWRTFVVAVGVVLFLAFVLEPARDEGGDDEVP